MIGMSTATPAPASNTTLGDHIAHATPYVENGEIIRPHLDECPHCEASLLLPDIHAAWVSNPTARTILWAIQDGYGTPGFTPEQGMDWSGVRDSSPEAVAAMWTAVHA